MNDGWQASLRAGVSDRYRILQELGGGGMSATYIAEEVGLGRNVVLKALPADMASRVNAERFEREIHVAARLQHAFIVPLLAAGITKGHPWYTMPLVHGDSLRARLSREGALPPTAVARILRDVAEALAHAHAQGVVHRDIKPDNILLSGSHALVTDFGVAKALAVSAANHSAITDIGLALGTPAYMAPEQATGDTAIDHRADLYALGATAYEMLAGRPVFGQRPPAQLLIAHATQSPEPLATLVPTAPAELTQLVERLLAKHPNDRPTHAQDVADALGHMLTRWSSGELPPASGRVTLGRALALWGASSVGVGIAAWLSVRWLPVPEWTLPATMLVMLAGLPVIVLAVWLHRPPRPVSTTPSVASTTAVGRIEAIVRPHLDWRRAKLGGFVAVGALVLLVALWGMSRATGVGPAATLRSRGVVGANDLVLVADFDSPANDTSLGIVVSDLLRTDLGRSESLELVDLAVRNRMLVSMALPVTERVTAAVASDMAQRAGAKVFVAGTVSSLGKGFLIRARMVEAETGREVASFRESAPTYDAIMNAVGRLGRDVRNQLGMSLREIRGTDPLYWAVTPSLEAARLYTDGFRLGLRGDQRAALQVLQRAVDLDSTFAMAFRVMAQYFQNLGDFERSGWAAARAFQYRDKLPTIQRLIVEGTYYSKPIAWNVDKTIKAYQAALDLRPAQGVGVALNNLALAYTTRRDYALALPVWERALTRDSTSLFASHTIVATYWALGRKDDARRHVNEKLPLWQPGSAGVTRKAAELAAADFLHDSAGKLLEELFGQPSFDSASGVGRAAQHLLYEVYETRGMTRRALEYLARSTSGDDRAGIPELDLARAQTAWLMGQNARSQQELDSAVSVHPPNDASALGFRWLEVAATYARSGATEKARQFLRDYEKRTTPALTSFHEQPLALTKGWIAVAERRFDDAITAFRAADVRVCRVCALPPLAHAYDLAGQTDSAIAVFERYLSTNDLGRSATDAFFLAGTYKRLGELYEARGDKERALLYYDRFVDLWKNADPELQPRVQEVRRRAQSLRRTSG